MQKKTEENEKTMSEIEFTDKQASLLAKKLRDITGIDVFKNSRGYGRFYPPR